MKEYQPPAVLLQAAPIQNQWYPILAATQNVTLHALVIGIAAVGETLELQMTVDGEIIPGTVAAAAGAQYWVSIQPSIFGDEARFAAAWAGVFPILLTGRVFEILVRKTTAAGAGNLQGCATYMIERPR